MPRGCRYGPATATALRPGAHLLYWPEPAGSVPFSRRMWNCGVGRRGRGARGGAGEGRGAEPGGEARREGRRRAPATTGAARGAGWWFLSGRWLLRGTGLALLRRMHALAGAGRGARPMRGPAAVAAAPPPHSAGSTAPGAPLAGPSGACTALGPRAHLLRGQQLLPGAVRRAAGHWVQGVGRACRWSGGGHTQRRERAAPHGRCRRAARPARMAHLLSSVSSVLFAMQRTAGRREVLARGAATATRLEMDRAQERVRLAIIVKFLAPYPHEKCDDGRRSCIMAGPGCAPGSFPSFINPLIPFIHQPPFAPTPLHPSNPPLHPLAAKRGRLPWVAPRRPPIETLFHGVMSTSRARPQRAAAPRAHATTAHLTPDIKGLTAGRWSKVRTRSRVKSWSARRAERQREGPGRREGGGSSSSGGAGQSCASCTRAACAGQPPGLRPRARPRSG
jgi:hypothetical protein